MSLLTSTQALPTLMLAVPVTGACLLLAGGRHLPRWAVDGLATGVAVLGVALAALLVRATGSGRLVVWAGGWQPRPQLTVGIVLVADRTNAGIALLIAGLAAIALLFGWRYFDSVHAHYQALILLFLTGMTGFALSGDLFDMFVFFELMGAAAYALTGFKIEDAESVQGGLTFGVVNSLGAYLCLIGIALLYAHTGQLGLPQLGTALAGHPADPLVLAAFVLICTGWLVKAAAVPFHFWLADAHAVAPAPVCVLFSGVMAPLGIYGVARIYWVVFRGVLPDPAVHRMLLVVGVVTALLGSAMSVTQRHIKRLLAYSTIAHIGLFLIGIAALSSLGVAGTAVYLLAHAPVKGALFLLTGLLLSRHRSVDELSLFGRGRDHRLGGGAFAVGALALAGLPPFGTGLGKSLLDEAGHSPALTLLTVAVSALTGGAALRVALRVYFAVGPRPDPEATDDRVSGRDEEPDARPPHRTTPASMFAAIALLLAFGLAVGVFPQVGRAAGQAAAAFVDQRGYLEQALHGVTGPAAQAAPATAWTTSGVLLGVLSAALAVGVALVGLFGRALPEWLLRSARRLRPALVGLHRLHSGHVGDYAAWLVLGVAALAGLLVLG
ncbi:MAG TPA: complex I subunit 5 family protein [Pseudonocardiaceae bacterium]|nr:complex I subunit 5 family protein [Pseudonocardiaceae bacterium]